jgi:hypothetical protein
MVIPLGAVIRRRFLAALGQSKKRLTVLWTLHCFGINAHAR